MLMNLTMFSRFFQPTVWCCWFGRRFINHICTQRALKLTQEVSYLDSWQTVWSPIPGLDLTCRVRVSNKWILNWRYLTPEIKTRSNIIGIPMSNIIKNGRAWHEKYTCRSARKTSINQLGISRDLITLQIWSWISAVQNIMHGNTMHGVPSHGDQSLGNHSHGNHSHGNTLQRNQMQLLNNQNFGQSTPNFINSPHFTHLPHLNQAVVMDSEQSSETDTEKQLVNPLFQPNTLPSKMATSKTADQLADKFVRDAQLRYSRF